MLTFSISYPHLINYFEDTTEGPVGDDIEGDFIDNFKV